MYQRKIICYRQYTGPEIALFIHPILRVNRIFEAYMTINGEQDRFERVMIIDDDEVDRYSASYIMKKNLFAKHIIEFGLATQAIEYLEKNQDSPDLLPEIILLDINMPRMNGFEFLERLANLHLCAKISCCIVMLTSSNNPRDHKRAEEDPIVNEFLNKPLQKTDLEIINRAYG